MGAFLRLLTICGLASPELKAEIKKGIDDWAAAAKATPGKADDTIVGILKTLLIIVGLYG